MSDLNTLATRAPQRAAVGRAVASPHDAASRQTSATQRNCPTTRMGWMLSDQLARRCRNRAEPLSCPGNGSQPSHCSTSLK